MKYWYSSCTISNNKIYFAGEKEIETKNSDFCLTNSKYKMHLEKNGNKGKFH